MKLDPAVFHTNCYLVRLPSLFAAKPVQLSLRGTKDDKPSKDLTLMKHYPTLQSNTLPLHRIQAIGKSRETLRSCVHEYL